MQYITVSTLFGGLRTEAVPLGGLGWRPRGGNSGPREGDLDSH